MKPLSFRRHRFPADVIRHAVWLYFRFNLIDQAVAHFIVAFIDRRETSFTHYRRVVIDVTS